MAHAFTRIFSDLHYGDRATRVRDLRSLAPLLDGPERVIFNGDTLDTRPSRHPERVNQQRREVLEFVAHFAPPATLITGNHDPDISDRHAVELEDGAVLVSHGDVIFDDLVPWSRDAKMAGRHFRAALAAMPEGERGSWESRLIAMRRAAAQLPQRHQSEPHGVKYLLGLFADVAWPPTRVLRVLHAWRNTPAAADRVLRRFRPRAQFFVMGHTHRLGTWTTGNGRTILNTGAYCPPTGAAVVDVYPGRLVMREVERRAGEYRIGAARVEFSLAARAATERLPA